VKPIIRFGTALLLVFISAVVMAQPLQQPNSSELQLAIARLNVLGRVLYIGAHPDDENTALLAYLAKERLVDAAYLSLTRGDGGQNLLGSEKGELMGVIRTQELLAARRIDGAHQFFTRAIDFGYSKSSDESLQIWGHDAVLADVVLVIRRFQPDVIIARFLEGDNGGHGHHSASAILAREAFQAAANPAQFPGQLAWLKPWQAKRLLWNGWRLDPSAEDSLLQVDTGLYNPLLGRSYTEIAAQSRSMHKSQGFGSAERRGSRNEFFRHLGGEYAPHDLFDGVDLSWHRVTPSADTLTALFREALRRYTPSDPAAALPPLLRALGILQSLPANPYVEQKQGELLEALRACSGLWLEAAAEAPIAAAGDSLRLSLQAVNRSSAPWLLEKIAFSWGHSDTIIQAALANNQSLEIKTALKIATGAPLTQPYWLREPAARGLYQVADIKSIGEPESPPAAAAHFTLRLQGQSVVLPVPLLYRWTDPVEGDLYRPFVIGPPVVIQMEEPLLLFPDRAAKPLHIQLASISGAAEGTVALTLPRGWRCEPERIPFKLLKKEETLELQFRIQPLPDAENGLAAVEGSSNGRSWGQDLVTINYPHIPIQTIFAPAQVRLLHLPLPAAQLRIGYIMGAGDEIPACLEQMGYPVKMLSDGDLAKGDFSGLQVIITGVRAYNTRPILASANPRLLDFVKAGGTLIVQYNTPFRLMPEQFAPWPLRLSRDRVSDEEAPVVLLAPGHQLLNKPCKITKEDFSGWVQERGLNFADQWDNRYETVLSAHDPGETDKKGGMLYARYGKGVYIFSGYAWFRQLPAGVPGAWRLFTNLIHSGESR
jgi:LmbE family N-acetylglucosaminyl deacetylase